MALVVYSADPMKTARRKKEWFDDDSFWRELYPFMFPEKRIADANEHIAKALALTKPAGKSVLDLCCGPGRCSIALAKRGFRVTGVDRTTYLLNKARARARRHTSRSSGFRKTCGILCARAPLLWCSACLHLSGTSMTSERTCPSWGTCLRRCSRVERA